jgi:lysophospholipase L1-like esterase
MAYQPPIKYLFAPDQWSTQWHSALNASSSSPATVVVLGDSFTQGEPTCSDYMSKTYFALFRSNLLAKYTQGGDFYGPQYSSDFYVNGLASSFKGTAPFSSVNTTNRTWAGGGFGEQLMWLPNPGAGNLITFTTPYACTDIDIITCDYNAGSWTYTVDGGATQTVTIASNDGSTLRRTQITGLANTTHTVVFTGQSTSQVLLLYGVATYKSRTAGLRFGWTSVCGSSMANYLLGFTPLVGSESVWQGRSNATLTGFGFPAQPDLAIIALGINDCQNNTASFSLQGYQGAMRRLCDSIRRGVPNASILFVAHNNPSGGNSDVTAPFFNARSWPDYIDRMLNISIDYNCALVNMHAKWGVTGVAQGFQTATNPHPTDTGHADIASILDSIL